MPLGAIWCRLNLVSFYNNSFTFITIKEKYIKSVFSLIRVLMLAGPGVSERRQTALQHKSLLVPISAPLRDAHVYV